MKEQERIKIEVGDGAAIPNPEDKGLVSAWWLALIGALALIIILPVAKPDPFLKILLFVPDGILITFEVTVLSISLAIVIGLVTGLGRISRNKFFNLSASLYVEVVRGIPLLVQLFYIYYALGRFVRVPDLVAAVVAMAFCYGAYMGEVFRAGLRGSHPFRIASGPNTDDYAWTDTMMREAGWMIDGLDMHYYTVVGPWSHKGSATDFGEREWFTAMQRAERMDTLITRHSTIMDRYDPAKRVWLIVGEWGMWHDPEPGSTPGFLYQQNTLRDAVVAGLHLNIFNSHADRVRMANIAQTVNVLQSMILTQGDQMVLTPTYWVFDMYKVHQDATLLPLNIKSDAYTFDGQSVPAVSASASKDKDGRIHITLVNLDPNRGRTVQVDIRGQQVSSVSGRVLTAATMQADNTFEQPNAVQPADFRGARLSGGVLTLDLPSKSVVVVELR